MSRPVSETAASAARATPPRMSFEEFLEWTDEDTWAEWVAGEVIVLGPASTGHQRLVVFLATILQLLGQERNLGEIFIPPFLIKLSASGREPDILFVARSHMDRLRTHYLDGPADLVIEIISPSSRGRDRGDKFYEYEQAGISEYWMLDPDRRRAEFYQLDADGVYRSVSPDEIGVYRSAAMTGLWVDVNWFWQDPLPSLHSVFKAWNLV